VKMAGDITSWRKIFQGRFWTHCNQAVMKRCFVCDRKGLWQDKDFSITSSEYSFTWSSTAINWVTKCSTFSRVNTSGSFCFLSNPSNVLCLSIFTPRLSSCILFQTGRGIAQWCSGMFSALHRSWYTI
jgi:hypothetical protein